MEELKIFAEKFDLTKVSAPPTDVFVLVDDITKAYDFATMQCLEGNEDWTDLRENMAAETLGAAYEINDGSQKLDEVFGSWQSWKFRFPQEMIDAGVASEVESDFLLIAKSLTIPSSSSSFFEMLLNFYRAGYWPCGWQGEYPKGHILVYKFGT